MMRTVTISPTFQIELPTEITYILAIEVGQKLQVLLYNNRIELIPLHPMPRARGFQNGMDTTIEDEPYRV